MADEQVSSGVEESMVSEAQVLLWSDEELGLDPEGAADRPLHDRERVFVECYCGKYLMNGTASAREARYAFPDRAACKLLKRPLIRTEVKRRLDDMLQLTASKEAVLTKLAAIAHGDLGQLARALPDPDNITLKDLQDLPPHITAAIKKFKVHRSEGSVRRGAESTVDLELHDPKAAIELIAKICSFLSESVDLTSGGEPLKGGAAGGPLEIIVRREPTGIALRGPGVVEQAGDGD